MEFRIADTFTSSLAKLASQEQRAVKTTAFDLQLNPAHPSLQFHRLDAAKDPDFWSLRVNLDIRIIVHKTAASLLLCYVDHHEDAYAWALKRKIARHPTTGAAQLVEVRERVEEVLTFVPIEADAPALAKPLLFAAIDDELLLRYGVPAEWLADVRQATEDTIFAVAEHLPQEAAEALLELATGGTPTAPAQVLPDSDPFAHPDAQRRFRVLQNVAELERALEYPWDKWSVFLHPAQRHLVERDYSGPARVSGSAGTGKTIVALHRAVFLARRHPEAQVVLLTFSEALANALSHKLLRLIGNEPQLRDRINIYATREFAQELYAESFGEPAIATPEQLRELLAEAASKEPEQRFSPQFLFAEWSEVVDVWGIDGWERYRDVPRLGRKTRIGGRQRETLWAIFSRVQLMLFARGMLTWPMLLRRVSEHCLATGERPFDFAIIDESQDLDVAELRFLAQLGDQRPDSLFFTGDLGQRIFQQPFPWKAVGVDVRGRAQTLAINYRTSHQIRQQADRLLPRSLTDVDGNVEARGGTISIFNGPAPTIDIFADQDAERQAVGGWIAARLAEGIRPEEIGVFVRSAAQMPRALAAILHAGTLSVELDHYVASPRDRVALSTMHLAKGLEFRAVAIMACDDEVLPLQERIERVTDESDLEEIYTTERHLLYVACTRARDHLLVSGVDPASEFLDDMR
ncbi:UvrD-helicase domain-containing protein [Oscillochloris sp. ZM17-4]|uniref:3'-5' exonuclease n=1 Tax=Oscillochloris sp. ZM17-4 TaxID=2866714 RepID=UPI001C7390EF|nr:3'-5' exonuclease [Oscillochloris sp. ZM17-4]MBX0331268.1 UvrD-helicase domain-containing protein [Oscillochloris sp. ZM17-4]